MANALIRTLLRTSGSYASGYAVGRAARVLLYPVLLATLAPPELGLIGLFEMTGAFVGALMGLKLESAITRYYWDWKRDHVERESLGALWSCGTAFNLVFAAALLAAGAPFFGVLASQLPFFPFAFAALIAAFCQWQSLFLLLVLRAKDAVREYSLIYAATEVVTTGVAVTWVVFGGGGAASYASGWAVGWLIVTGVVLWRLLPHVAIGRTALPARELFRFALPLIPRDFTSLAGGFLDRFFLDKFLGTREIGLYTAGTKIGAAVLAANSATKHAWIPWIMRQAAEGEHDESHGAAGTFHLVLLTSIAIAVAFAGELFLYLTPGSGYGDVQRLVPLFALAYLFAGASNIVSVGIYIQKSTDKLLWLALCQIAFQIAVYPIALRHWGYVGAAIVLCSINAAAVAAGYAFSQRYYPIAYGRSTISMLGSAFATLAVLRLLVNGPPQLWWLPYLPVVVVAILVWRRVLRSSGIAPHEGVLASTS